MNQVCRRTYFSRAARKCQPWRCLFFALLSKPKADLVKATQVGDVLIHEDYSAAELKPEDRPRGKDWPQYCREFHTSDVELGVLDAHIQPKFLILDHTIRFRSER